MPTHTLSDAADGGHHAADAADGGDDGNTSAHKPSDAAAHQRPSHSVPEASGPTRSLQSKPFTFVIFFLIALSSFAISGRISGLASR